MKDPIERGESCCEQWADENVVGDVMTCSCGNTCLLGDAETLSPDPYAIPICPDCFDQAMSGKYGKDWLEKLRS